MSKLSIVPARSDFADSCLKHWSICNLSSSSSSSPSPAGDLPSTQDILLNRSPSSSSFVAGEEGGSAVDRLISAASSLRASIGSIKPGSLLLSSPTSHVLTNQHLHKSVVLVLSDDIVATVGVCLNRPTAAGVEVTIDGEGKGKGRRKVVPVLFGGEYARKGNGDGQHLWFHNSDRLKSLNVGAAVNADDGEGSVYVATSEQAARAIEGGVADVGEFLVVRGVCIWTKGEKGTFRGMEGEVRDGKFSLIDDDRNGEGDDGLDRVGEVWSRLLAQGVAEGGKIEDAVKRSEICWEIAGGNKGGSYVERLADQALMYWIKLFITGF